MSNSITQNVSQCTFDFDTLSDQPVDNSALSPQKKCTICLEMKPLTNFDRNKASHDGHQSSCKTCYKQRRQQSPARVRVDPGPTKKCNICLETKIIADFTQRRQNRDGFSHWCKSCSREKRRQRPKVHVDPGQTKECTICLETKLIAEFYEARDGLYGVKAMCKPCYEARHRGRQKYRGYNYKNYPKYIRAYALRDSYGMTVAQYDEMLAHQNGVCALCGLPETMKGSNGAIRRLSVDHDHSTGVVRKLLCRGCNTMLGNAKDNPELLRKAADYLDSFQ